MDLTTQQDRYRTAVEGIEHAFEDMEGLEFIDQQRVFLLVRRILHGLLEVIQLTEMLFPLIVDDIEEHTFLELLDHLFAVRFRCPFEVDGDIIDAFTVRDGYEDVLVLLTLVLIDALDNRIGDLHEFVHTALEAIQRRLSDLITQFVCTTAVEGILVKRHLDRKSLHDIHGESFVIPCLTCLSGHRVCQFVDHVGDIDPDTLTHEGVTAFGVDEVTLLVHDIIVFDESFTDTEVVLLDFLLRPFDGVGDHRVLDHLTFLEAQTVHDTGDTLGTEHTHQVILERYVEDGTTRVTLTTGTTTQLTVHTTGLVPLRTDDSQTTRFFHLRRQLDIGTTTGHVRSNRNDACTTGFGNDLCLLLVQLGVEDVMFDFTDGKQFAEEFGYLNGSGTHEDRTTLTNHELDLVDDRVVLLPLGAVDTVVHIDTGDRFVGRDDDYVEFVDVPELTCFRLSGTGHTGELVVHTEVVLQRDGGKGLRRRFDLHIFLGFDGLVQTIRPTTTFHDTTRLLIDDLHLTAVDDIIDVFLKEGVGLEQLVHGVYTLGFDRIVGVDIVFALLTLFRCETGLMLEFRHLGTYVRQDEEMRIVGRTGEGIDTFIGQFDGLVLLVDDEIEFIRRDMHVLLILLEVELLGLLHAHFDTRFREELDECLGFRQTLEGTEQCQFTFLTLLAILRTHLCFGFGKEFGGQRRLLTHEVCHTVLVLIKHLVITLGDRTGDDQRGTGVIDQDGVHLIDDRVVMAALHEVER